LRHFWVDTCCINKKNYAELSHTIGSMFCWYRKATRCYVYLSDVPPKERRRDGSLNDTWDSDFRESRWFTRGWTLQELLAPASVEFFSRECKRLGDKTSLHQQIHEITAVSKSALHGDPLSQFSVNERMSWINSRQTKLEEDKGGIGSSPTKSLVRLNLPVSLRWRRRIVGCGIRHQQWWNRDR